MYVSVWEACVFVSLSSTANNTVFKVLPWYVEPELNGGLTPRPLLSIFTACWLRAFIFFIFSFKLTGGDRENWIEVLAAVKDFVLNWCIFLFYAFSGPQSWLLWARLLSNVSEHVNSICEVNELLLKQLLSNNSGKHLSAGSLHRCLKILCLKRKIWERVWPSVCILNWLWKQVHKMLNSGR